MNKNTLGNLIGAAILVVYVGISYLLYDPSETPLKNYKKKLVDDKNLSVSSLYELTTDSIFFLHAFNREDEGVYSTAFLINELPGMLDGSHLVTANYNILDELGSLYENILAINVKDDFKEQSNWHEVFLDKIVPFHTEDLKGVSYAISLNFKNIDRKFNHLEMTWNPGTRIPGEKYYMIGNPEGFLGVITELTYLRKENFSTDVYQGIAKPGTSGAPIINEKGRVVGMVTASNVTNNEVYSLPLYLFPK